MNKPTVALCMPVFDTIHPLNFQSYRFLDRSDLGGWHHLSVIGHPIDEARNLITAEALTHPEITHLLWIDDDMVYPADALKRLLSYDLPIVGGLCHDRRHPYKPVIARYFDPSWGSDPGTYGWLFDYPEDERIEVDATGGAFLLVKREVFERVRDEFAPRSGPDDKIDPGWSSWWTPIPEHHGRSEDLAFCWRAKKAGYSIVVDTGLDIGHVGEVVVDKHFARTNRAFEYSRWHPPVAALADAARLRPATDPIVKDLTSPARPHVASIVVTAFNPKPEQLRAAVLSALAQTVPCEVIVVDDGSEGEGIDPTWGVWGMLRDLPEAQSVNYIRHPRNRGISAALNTGIAAMNTDWFCWLPCDDLFEPNKVELQLTSLLNANSLAGYHGYNLKIDNRNQVGHVPTMIFRDQEEQNRVLRTCCAINGTTVMLHRDVLRAIEMRPGVFFDPELRYGQDWAMWRRVGFKFRWHGIPDKLATRREFGNLTEKLKRSKDVRKIEEDRIVSTMEE